MSTEEDRRRALLWNAPLPPPRQPKPGELLFEFQRARDKRFVRVELRFHGESYGWEVQFIEDDGWLFYGHGASRRARWLSSGPRSSAISSPRPEDLRTRPARQKIQPSSGTASEPAANTD